MIINKLIWRYLKSNKRRTLVTIVSIYFSVVIMTVLLLAVNYSYLLFENAVIAREGNWHARFCGINREQYLALETKKEIAKSSISKRDGDLYDINIELYKPDESIFEKTQKWADEIEMSVLDAVGNGETLPDGSLSRYNISYHMNLLEFYGVKDKSEFSLSMEQILHITFISCMVIGSLFIWNGFEISFAEKIKFIKLMSSVYALSNQKARFVLGEAAIFSISCVPIGVLTGCLLCVEGFEVFRSSLEAWLSYGNLPEFSISYKFIILIFILGIGMIFLGAILPVIKSRKISNSNYLEGLPDQNGRLKRIRKFSENKSVESQLAIRNLRINKKRAIVCSSLIACSLIVSMNGYVYFKLQSGGYSLKDDRKRVEGDVWINMKAKERKEAQDLGKKIEQLPEVDTAIMVNELPLMGILLEKKYIRSNLNEFKVYGYGIDNPVDTSSFSNLKGDYYGFSAEIIAMEDELFEKYAENIGADLEKIDTIKYPVIIGDYLPVKTNAEDKPSYGSVMGVEEGEKVQIIFGEKADMLFGNKSVFADQLNSVNVDVLCATDEVPPIPKRPEELKNQINRYVQFSDASLKIYMSHSTFENFIKQSELYSTYMPLKEDELDENGVFLNEKRSILSYVYLEKKSGVSDHILKHKLEPIFEEYGFQQISDNDILASNDGNGQWEYCSVDLEKEIFSSTSIQWIKEIFFLIGELIIWCFLISCLVNYIVTSTIIRKRELAIYCSLGMHRYQFNKMMAWESFLQICLGSITGIVVGTVLVITQFIYFQKTTAIIPEFPFANIGISLLLIVGVISIVLLVLFKTMNKFNVIETIKNENI